MTDNDKSIFSHFDTGKPYLIVMRNGHEYNCFLDSKMPDGWILGKVAKRMTVTLYKPGADFPGLLVSLDPEEIAERKFEDKEVFIHEPCHVRHSWQSIRVFAGDISLLEDSWRRAVEVKEDGSVNEDSLLVSFPEFGAYRMESGGFSSNPDVNKVYLPLKNMTWSKK